MRLATAAAVLLCAGAVRAERFVELGPTRAQRDSSVPALDFPRCLLLPAEPPAELTAPAMALSLAWPKGHVAAC